MNDPRISVLLPARDAAATLPACLASIRRQREPRFECVVVDDGSRDATRALAESVAACDARFRVLGRAPEGLVAALNRGLAACRAPLVARMDADDLMHRDRLAAQAAALDAAPRLDGVGCHVRVFPRAGLRPGLRDYEAWLRGIDDERRVREERFVECPLPHPTWMLRRAALDGLGGWRACGWPEDYDLLLRLLGAGGRLSVVPRRLLAWRDGPARLWRTHPDYAPARFLACKAHFLAAGPLRHGHEYVLWGYGETGKALRRALAAEGRQPAWILELHPGRIGEVIHGAPVLRPDAVARLPGLPIVVSVAGGFARAEIRAWLARMGLRECVDYWCAA